MLKYYVLTARQTPIRAWVHQRDHVTYLALLRVDLILAGDFARAGAGDFARLGDLRKEDDVSLSSLALIRSAVTPWRLFRNQRAVNGKAHLMSSIMMYLLSFGGHFMENNVKATIAAMYFCTCALLLPSPRTSNDK